ncbi:PorV/PorQ family protein [bacterium]|nr:PorV/PorQ family protein [bacterium]
MKKTIIIGLILMLAVFSVYSQNITKKGTTAAGFLNIDVGARAVSMGSAFVTVSDDPTAVYWNPAGLTQLHSTQAMFSHTKWLADITFNYAALALPLPGIGTVGASATFLTMDEMEKTTIENPMGTGEMFSAGSYAFALSYARKLTDRFAIGGNIKYVSERIYHSSANGVALDVGTLFQTQFNGLMIGMSISNYGTKMRMSGRDMLIQTDPDPSIGGNNPNIPSNMETNAFDMPLMFRVGMSMDVLKWSDESSLKLAMDAMHPNDDVEYVNIGMECILYRMIALRTGYKTLFAGESEEGLAMGCGLNTKIASYGEIKLDYAYQQFGILKNIQKFTVTMAF